IRCSVVRAFGGVASALIPDRMVRDGMLIGLVAVASVAVRCKIDAPFIMAATLVSSLTGLGFASIAMRRLRPHASEHILPAYAAQIWRQTAVPLVIIGAAEALMNRTGVLLLGWMGETRDAG